MTIKSTGRAPVSIPVSTAKPAAAAKPTAAPARPAADGFGTSSSFGSTSSAASGSAARSLGNPDAPVSSASSAATGGGSSDSITPKVASARDLLKDIDGSTEALAKCFKTELATQKDLSAAMEEFDALRQAGALSPEQEKTINDALAGQVGLRGAADMSRSFLDKIMAELNKKRD
jgi:hypothetical protein